MEIVKSIDQALLTSLAYHTNPNYGNIPDVEIDEAHIIITEFVRNVERIIYEVLRKRPFDKVSQEDTNIYDAYCLRVAETVMMKCEDKSLRKV